MLLPTPYNLCPSVMCFPSWTAERDLRPDGVLPTLLGVISFSHGWLSFGHRNDDLLTAGDLLKQLPARNAWQVMRMSSYA